MVFYDGFISYSHAKDKPIASELQSVVQKLGKPWYRRRALRLFRDDTSLSATPHLWPTIEQALGQSRFLILLASPEAAASAWVNKEVVYWLDHKSEETLLIAVTSGDVAWDNVAGDFAWSESTPLPPALKGRFSVEPKWVDLCAYRDDADKRDAKFTELSADLAAAIHGTPKEDLLSQEVRQQRRALTLAWSAAAVLLVLAVSATAAGVLAYRAQREAVEQRTRAERTLNAATETANGLVLDIAVRLRKVAGVPSTLVKDILDRARKLQDQLIGVGEVSLELRRSQSMALNESSVTFATLGDISGALAAAEQAQAILQSLLAGEPDNAEWQRALAFSKSQIGAALESLGKLDAALVAHREAVAIMQTLVAKNPGNSVWQSQLSGAYIDVSDVLKFQSKLDEALAAVRSALSISQALVAKEPDNTDRQLDLSANLDRLGGILQQLDRLDEALATFHEGLALAQAAVKKAPDNLFARDLVWRGHGLIGAALKNQGKFDEALSALRDEHAIAQAVVEMDANNTDWQGALLDGEA